jgi:exopolysaccharide biosynthesis predicted pyruvyltransferase EpsI
MAAFQDISDLLSNKVIRFVRGKGNVGDGLIDAGTKCLFKKINTTIDNSNSKIDYIVWSGGGNLGTLYKSCYKSRQLELKRAIDKSIPFIILPQSATNNQEPVPNNVRVFARELLSMGCFPQSTLAPDLALAYDNDISDYSNITAELDIGVFLRKDPESIKHQFQQVSLADPAHLCRSYEDYFRVVSLFDAVITDRLHLAIASLMVGRKTTLLPNNYNKNRGMYEAWLCKLGCHWGDMADLSLINDNTYNRDKVISSFCRSYKQVRNRD